LQQLIAAPGDGAARYATGATANYLLAAMRDPIFADAVDAHERARNSRIQRIYVLEIRLGHLGAPIGNPGMPRVGFFPFKGSGFETFIGLDPIVRVCFLASLTFSCLVKTRTSRQKQ
jgi:hypothetical protein